MLRKICLINMDYAKFFAILVMHGALFAAEPAKTKITSQEVFGYLERGFELEQQFSNEMKLKIEGYFSRRSRVNREKWINYIDKKEDHLFVNFKVQSLEQFISPGTAYMKAAFVGPDTLMLIMQKDGSWYSSNLTCDIILIDAATFATRKLAENFMLPHHFKSPHLYFYQGQPLLFVADKIKNDNKCYNLATGIMTHLPGLKIAGFTANQEYLVLNEHQGQGTLYFLKPGASLEDSTKTITLPKSFLMKYHPDGTIAFRSGDNKVTLVKGHEMIHHTLPQDSVNDSVRAINFNKRGNLLACKTWNSLYVWDDEEKMMHVQKCDKIASRIKFINDSVLVMANGTLVPLDSNTAIDKDTALHGHSHKTNKEGLIVFGKMGRVQNRFLAEYIPGKPTAKEIAQLTLKQKHFIELLAAFELAYQDKVKELKEKDPQGNRNIVRINTLLRKIPERVRGFSHEDIQLTWQSLAHMQTYLKKRFNVVE